MSVVKIKKTHRNKPLGGLYLHEVRVFVDDNLAAIVDDADSEFISEIERVMHSAVKLARDLAVAFGAEVQEEERQYGNL